MLCQFMDHVKNIELLVVDIDVLPAQKEEVLIRGIFYVVIKRIFDYVEEPAICRLFCEVRV